MSSRIVNGEMYRVGDFLYGGECFFDCVIAAFGSTHALIQEIDTDNFEKVAFIDRMIPLEDLNSYDLFKIDKTESILIKNKRYMVPYAVWEYIVDLEELFSLESKTGYKSNEILKAFKEYGIK